ncbi:MAG: hypothetical protein QXS02_06650, partial [Candidatus Thermoplasmatota archaeon]
KAGCTITQFGWTWTPFIIFNLSSPILSNKIRFWAWYDWLHCNTVDVDLYYNGGWRDLYQGGFNDRIWTEKNFNTQLIYKARIRFQVQRWILWPATADLHEFQFYKLP